MTTFKAYLRKEIIESSRQYRYVILAVGIIFFAISGPILLKLLPEILKSQVNGDTSALNALFVTTRRGAMQGLIKDLFQTGSLFTVFALCGVLSDELTTQKFMFPYAKGSKPAGIVLAKAIHYGIVITIFTFIGFIANYYYSNLLFKGDDVPFSRAMISASLVSLYFFFNLILTMFLSSIIKRGIVSGILVLAINYLLTIFNNVKYIGELLPYKLVDTARLYSSVDVSKTVAVILTYCIILGVLIVYRMSKVEVV